MPSYWIVLRISSGFVADDFAALTAFHTETYQYPECRAWQDTANEDELIVGMRIEGADQWTAMDIAEARVESVLKRLGITGYEIKVEFRERVDEPS